MTDKRHELDWDAVWWGLILLSAGIVFMLINTGVLERTVFATWWTVLPIVFGIVRLVTGRSAKALSEGVFLVIVGGWLSASFHQWMGLSWRNSWPLVLIAIGASTLTETIAGYFMPKPAKGGKEDSTCIL